MEELIFFAIIIFFSIIDSIARSRKKRQKGLPGEAPSPAEWEWDDDDELETYDDEPSYDERYEVEQESEPEPLPEYTRPYGSTRTEARKRRTSSEGMIPTDIWEEIAGLTRGKTREPAPPRPPPVEVEQIPPRPISTHRVHRAHAGYGTDPSSRLKSAQDDLDPLRRTLSKDARAVRRQLRSHSKHALRRAVILQEILGPPAATRPERFDEPIG